MPAMAPLTVKVGDTAPARGGLLSVARSLKFLHDVADPHIGAGASWEPDVCGVTAPAPGVCDDAMGIDPETVKEFDEFTKGDAQPFGLYKGIACDLLRDDYEGRTTHAFELGESYGVETAVDALLLKGATDIGGGTAHSVNDALGLLEAQMATLSGGQGIIHVSRYGAAWLAEEGAVKSDEDFHLWTYQGTPIVNGGGYTRTSPTSAAITGSQFWVYATGPMHIWRGPMTYSEGLGPEVNTKAALAERLYAVGADCYTIAVLIDPEPGA